jgi:hypothetical protein
MRCIEDILNDLTTAELKKKYLETSDLTTEKIIERILLSRKEIYQYKIGDKRI